MLSSGYYRESWIITFKAPLPSISWQKALS